MVSNDPTTWCQLLLTLNHSHVHLGRLKYLVCPSETLGGHPAGRPYLVKHARSLGNLRPDRLAVGFKLVGAIKYGFCSCTGHRIQPIHRELNQPRAREIMGNSLGMLRLYFLLGIKSKFQEAGQVVSPRQLPILPGHIQNTPVYITSPQVIASPCPPIICQENTNNMPYMQPRNPNVKRSSEDEAHRKTQTPTGWEGW